MGGRGGGGGEVDIYGLMVAAEGSDDSNPLETRVNQLFSKIRFAPRSKQNSVVLIYVGRRVK